MQLFTGIAIALIGSTTAALSAPDCNGSMGKTSTKENEVQISCSYAAGSAGPTDYVCKVKWELNLADGSMGTWTPQLIVSKGSIVKAAESRINGQQIKSEKSGVSISCSKK